MINKKLLSYLDLIQSKNALNHDQKKLRLKKLLILMDQKILILSKKILKNQSRI